MEVRGVDDQRFVGRNPGPLACLPETLGAQLRGPAGFGRLVTDRGDATAPEREQVLSGLAGRRHVVDNDVIGDARKDPLAEQHEGGGVRARPQLLQ